MTIKKAIEFSKTDKKKHGPSRRKKKR